MITSGVPATFPEPLRTTASGGHDGRTESRASGKEPEAAEVACVPVARRPHLLQALYMRRKKLMLPALLLGLAPVAGLIHLPDSYFLLIYYLKRPVERVSERNPLQHRLLVPHLARYNWAKQFCLGKSVADIASGTGYGMKVLAEVATSVDGYDREDFGNNYVIDLDKQAWHKYYDVVVSFETIEHLSDPDFFLRNVRRTCDLLLLSTPVNEKPGFNPYHKQFWTFQELETLLGKYFTCQFLDQSRDRISPGIPRRTAVAVCTPH
jgi:hypothetical protein